MSTWRIGIRIGGEAERRFWMVVTIAGLLGPMVHFFVFAIWLVAGVREPATWLAEKVYAADPLAIPVLWVMVICGPIMGLIGSLILGLWERPGFTIGKLCGAFAWFLLLFGFLSALPGPWILLALED
jgi:hypothetical protein